MARAGLGYHWSCLFANDIDSKKAQSYIENWGPKEMKVSDVSALKASDIPAGGSLAWASFPCQDLSLAGQGAGLKGARSGSFWPFWRLIAALARQGRTLDLIVLENVCGALTSHGGRDFAAICGALARGGYRFGALVMDAADFLPQSRPRLFIAAVHRSLVAPRSAQADFPSMKWHTPSLMRAFRALPSAARKEWIWWAPPTPPPHNARLPDVLEQEPQGVAWHTKAETRKLLALMEPVNHAKVRQAMLSGQRCVGAVYKRARPNGRGKTAQRAEIRFDGLAGCLRTPIGGSSRQTILIVEGHNLRSRLLSPREVARLMGLPDEYALPAKYNDAYHLAGDGVAVPVVRHIAEHILLPVLRRKQTTYRRAA